MPSDRLIKKLEGIEKTSRVARKVEDLFKTLTNNRELWMMAYSRIYSNKGAMTAGPDSTTMDGFSEDRVNNLMNLLKEGRYRFKPVKRVYISKANGKKRPLGLSSGDDKLVQEVVRLLLERVYESIFSDRSHGFRRGRSCHTALKEIQHKWIGVNWIVNVDIRGFFNNMDHEILIQLLSKKIRDPKFLRLVKVMLKAGYLEDWKYHKTYSGAPQGSIVSPLLSNVYLHELDCFMENEQRKFNNGKRRVKTKEYIRLQGAVRYKRKSVRMLLTEVNLDEEAIGKLKEQIREPRKQMLETPCGDAYDPNFKRLQYIRYADDFLIGITGSKQDAKEASKKVQVFIENALKLQVASEKTALAHSTDGCRFLGYDIKRFTSQRVVKSRFNGTHATTRTLTGKIRLLVPKSKPSEFCKDRRYGNYGENRAKNRGSLFQRSDIEIVSLYNAEMRGLANYYSLAGNMKWELNKLAWIAETSLLITLAGKRDSTVSKIANRMKRGTDLFLKYERNGKLRQMKIFKLKHIQKPPLDWGKVDHKPNPNLYNSRSELLERLNAEQCEYCGKTEGYFEVHHVRRLKDVENGKSAWKKTMAKMNRKTLVMCVRCHGDLHAGKLPDWRHLDRKVESRVR